MEMEEVLCSATSLIWTSLGQKKVSLLVRCPDLMYTNAKCILFIKVSLFQGCPECMIHAYVGCESKLYDQSCFGSSRYTMLKADADITYRNLCAYSKYYFSLNSIVSC